MEGMYPSRMYRHNNGIKIWKEANVARKALLVGINDYGGQGDLRGCVNDVLDMHFSLRSLFGFKTEEIRVLTDRRATSANIKHRLINWLVKGAKAGDFLVFHYSGHGSQIRDRNGDEELTDNLDELICPCDIDWSDSNSYITDDELNKILGKVPAGALLEVFLDCCHSGTGLKEMGIMPPPPEIAPEHPTLNRYLPPPADIFLRFSGEEEALKKKGFQERAAKHHILWAGCMAQQTSADAFINDRYHGAFTYYLNSHLRRDPSVSRAELLKKVRDSLQYNGFSQIPQLEIDATSRGRTLFSGKK